MEKRKLSRVNFNIRALLSYKGLNFEGDVENLSLSGIFIRTGNKLDIGLNETMDIKINMLGSSSDLNINLKGIVVRNDEKGIGLKFEKVDLDSFIHLKNIIAYNFGDEDRIMDEFFNFISEKKDEA